MTTPSLEERPAKQCPPLRAVARNPERLANRIASETSAADAHRTTAGGLASWKRAMAGLRADS
jgi:hypothetical protein